MLPNVEIGIFANGFVMTGLEQDTALLQALAAHAKMSPSRLATEAGLADTTISRAYRGAATARLSQPTLEKLRARFPDFSGWRQSGAELAGYQSSPPASQSQPTSDQVEIDQIDWRYGLGGTYLDGPIESEKRSFPREWVRLVTHSPPELLFWTEGEGDSMEPTIRSGEPVLVDRSQRNPRTGDNIWAVAYGDIGMIKRLRPLRNGCVELLSDNQVVPPAIASDGELHVIGRVVAVVRRL